MSKKRNSYGWDGTDKPPYEYKNMTLRPHFLEYISMDLPFIILCIVGWAAYLCFWQRYEWGFFPLILLTLYLFLHCQYITTMKYHIGQEQLMYQRGLFSLKRDYIEMYRIVDYEEHRTFVQIILGLKSVTIHSCDRTSPSLKLIGIPSDVEVIPAIRERVEFCKVMKGVYEIANRI